MFVSPSSDNTFEKYEEIRLHMEAVLSSSILDLDMPMKIAIPLDNAGIRKIGDLVSRTPEDLLKINRIGIKAVYDIEKILGRFDLHLKNGSPH